MSFLSSNKFDNLIPAPIPERLKKRERILILTADKTEDLEFFYPYYRFNEAGYTVDVATINGSGFKAKNGYGLEQTKALSGLRPEDYALLYIPGGKAPAELRENAEVLQFVKKFAQTGKPIAAICHGPQVLISAGLIKGKRISAYSEVKKEVEEAGGIYVDEALVEDGQFITGRKPGDLHRHISGVFDYLEGRKSPQKIAS